MFRTAAGVTAAVAVVLSSLVACTADGEVCAAAGDSASVAAAAATKGPKSPGAGTSTRKPKKKFDIDDCD